MIHPHVDCKHLIHRKAILPDDPPRSWNSPYANELFPIHSPSYPTPDPPDTSYDNSPDPAEGSSGVPSLLFSSSEDNPISSLSDPSPSALLNSSLELEEEGVVSLGMEMGEVGLDELDELSSPAPHLQQFPPSLGQTSSLQE